MKTRSIFIFLAAGLPTLAVSSCGLKKEKITEEPPVKVAVERVSATKTGTGRSYTGTVTSGDGADVSFTVPGTVKAVYVAQGQKVAKGQLLAELKSDNLENANNIAQAALSEARDAYNRYKQLYEAKAVAEIKWVEIQNALKAAENSAAMAERALGDARIYSPVGGTVADKMIDVGQTVVPAVPAMRIVALSDVKVSIPVPENEIAAMTVGTKADISVKALDNMRLSGALSEKGVVANPLTRAYDVKFAVENPDGRLLPGMICDVRLAEADGNDSIIVVPTAAVLLAADNSNFVWLARDGKATRRTVGTGELTATGVVITSGISEGDSLITAGMQKVSEGTRIKPQN